jgi:hypothetical protein
LAWTGPLFTVAFYVVVFALEGSTPGEKASAQEVMDYYNSHAGATFAELFLAPAVTTLLILFLSYLRSVFRERRPDHPGGTVLMAGGIIWAGALLLGSVIQLMLVGSSDHGQEQVAETANVLGNDSWIPFIAGIAITLIGAGMSVLSSDVLPRWLGWVALVGGVISLAGPGGFLGFFLGPLWILVAGVMLARRPDPDRAAVAT